MPRHTLSVLTLNERHQCTVSVRNLAQEIVNHAVRLSHTHVRIWNSFIFPFNCTDVIFYVHPIWEVFKKKGGFECENCYFSVMWKPQSSKTKNMLPNFTTLDLPFFICPLLLFEVLPGNDGSSTHLTMIAVEYFVR